MAKGVVQNEESVMSDAGAYRRRRRTRMVISGLLAVALLAGGFAAIALASRARGASGVRAMHRQATITGSIHLSRAQVQAGRTVRGQLVFRNRTARTKILLRGCKIDGMYAIGVRASDGYLQQPAFALVACSPQQSMVAKPGTTVYRFKLLASYRACSQEPKREPPKGSKYWNPPCLKDAAGNRDVMPPLPAGQYTALFFPAGQWYGPRVRSASLVVTR